MPALQSAHQSDDQLTVTLEISPRWQREKSGSGRFPVLSIVDKQGVGEAKFQCVDQGTKR